MSYSDEAYRSAVAFALKKQRQQLDWMGKAALLAERVEQLEKRFARDDEAPGVRVWVEWQNE